MFVRGAMFVDVATVRVRSLRYAVFYGAICLSMLRMFSSFLERRPPPRFYR